MLEEVSSYKPKQPSKSDWDSVIERAVKLEDDGHSCKLVRALAHAEKVCAPYENQDSFRVKGNMWLQLGNMGEFVYFVHAQGIAR